MSNDQTAAVGEKPAVSVFLPVYNEEPNLRPLHAKLDAALRVLGRTAEIIYVDDGSTDGSLNILRELARDDDRVPRCPHRRGRGVDRAAPLQRTLRYHLGAGIQVLRCAAGR